MISVALWGAGIVLIALAVWRGRGPFARLGELDRLAENARRYESWRGGRADTTAAGDQTTGADIMRQMLRRQVYLWAAVGGGGVVLIIAGFVVR